MRVEWLSVLMAELLTSLSEAVLLDNESFIKRIWSRSRQLEVIDDDDIEGKKLISYAVKLWNTTVEMNILINSEDKKKLELLAMLKDTCFNILLRNEEWKENQRWSYLHIMTHVFKIWLDCGSSQNIQESLVDEMKPFKNVNAEELSELQARDLIRCMMYQSEYASSKENWIDLESFLERAIDILFALPEEEKKGEAAYLYYIIVDTANSMLGTSSKRSVDIISWIMGAVEKALQCGGHDYFPKYLRIPLLSVLGTACNKDTHILSSQQMSQILKSFEVAFSNEKCSLNYYLARISILLKSVSSSNESLRDTVQREYFEMVENILVLNNKDISMLSQIVYKLNQTRYVGVSSIMDGFDLLIHRGEGQLMETDVSTSTLYLFKVYLLSELAIENSKSLIELDDSVLRSTMDDVFLVKEDIGETDLSSIQVILWRTADLFYEKCMYKKALSWYRYALSTTRSTFQGNCNASVLSRRLSFCYMQENDANSAYECLRKGLTDSEGVEVTDYLLLFKYSLMQTLLPQEELIEAILRDMMNVSEFDPQSFATLLDYCHQHATRSVIVKIVFKSILSYYQMNPKPIYDKEVSDYAALQVHLLMYTLRCLVYIKTTVYEKAKGDGKTRTGKLNFRPIVDYIKDVCKILSNVGFRTLLLSKDNMLLNDLEWMLHTSWNFGLFCFSAGRNEEGTILFETANMLFPYFDGISYFTPEQDRIRTFLFTSAYILLHSQDRERSEDATIKEEDVLHRLEWIKEHNPTAHQNDAVALLSSLFQLEIYVNQKRFEEALQLFEASERLNECSYSVLDRMAGTVLLNTHCPPEYAFRLLTVLHSSVKLTEGDIHRYAKWTRIFISVALKRGIKADLFNSMYQIIHQELYKRVEYPQSELYYLIVVAWNEGITCFLKSEAQADHWCRVAFELLAHYRNVEKKSQLERQMNEAYNMFNQRQEEEDEDEEMDFTD